MNNERIDLDQLEEELANLQDMHFDTRLDERVANANMFNRMLNELARCYEEIDSLQGKIDKASYAMQRYCDEWPDLPYPDHRIDNVCDAYEEVCLALQ